MEIFHGKLFETNEPNESRPPARELQLAPLPPGLLFAQHQGRPACR